MTKLKPISDSSAKFEFASKAKTLEQLARRSLGVEFCDQIIVPLVRWRAERNKLVENILSQFALKPLAVRSSAANEDGWNESKAGAYLSLTNVANDAAVLPDAIDSVFASYEVRSDTDEVLIQPMVENVSLSGVVLTRDLDTGGPYYVINYDDHSGRTDTVTSGLDSKTILVHRSHPERLHSERMRKLIVGVQEIETGTQSHELDIEFCITGDERVFILQVRHLAARSRWYGIPDDRVDNAISDIHAALVARMQPVKGQAGQTTIFGEMPDWNPAEIIGNAPRPLALSLYKSLVTDRVWADARAEMGYRHMDAPLLTDFCGRPFIDVRLSLNSFLPTGLDEGFANRLVDHQLALLAERRNLHDKIEFEIAVTCHDFDFDRRCQQLKEAGFSAAELERFGAAITGLTRDAVNPGATGIRTLLERSAELSERAPPPASDLATIGALLDDCRRYGTLPFSILARHGFIGVSLLRSLVARGVLDQNASDRFMRSIDTVAGQLVHAIHDVSTGAKTTDNFLVEFGHLRPGTYDITSWRYDEKPEIFLGHAAGEEPSRPHPFQLPAQQIKETNALLLQAGYELDAQQLFDYISEAIKSREQAKFVFTRALSDALLAISHWGERLGLDREALSYLEIDDILGDHDAPHYAALISSRQERHHLTRSIRVPHLICEPDDIDIIRLPLGQPTFITNKAITAAKMVLRAHETPDIDGKIVLIESADPGYDWIFSHNIAGLITKYGGANSHMAIRSAEFGLPAAIGCGERLFESLSKNATIELNCAARKITGH